jgi:dolichol-phosphate mannosyltransferase
MVLFQYVTDTSILGYNPRQARGWTSLILTLLLLGSMQLFSLGILGEYVGRLFEESKARPVYIVKRLVNLEQAEFGTGARANVARRAAGI